jgi:threonine/homoserine/homoserine lactone efflux protein
LPLALSLLTAAFTAWRRQEKREPRRPRRKPVDASILVTIQNADVLFFVSFVSFVVQTLHSLSRVIVLSAPAASKAS